MLYYGRGMNDTLTIRLGAKLAQALHLEAQQTGLPKGEIARQALSVHFGAVGGTSTMQRHFGVMSGPADLSTNKSYRRSWSKKRA